MISKHGILIVQFANQLQHEGYDKRRAVEHAAAIRLRPVLMTTAALVLAVMPLILATGMTIGTFFTLFVVPAVYLVLARDHQAADGPSTV